MAMLKLFLLGGFEVRSKTNTSLAITATKAKALLAYLTLHPGQAQTRDKLAALLWGESENTQARQNLRQTLVSLRRALPEADQVIRTDGDTIRLTDAAIEVDVLVFEGLVKSGKMASLEQAVALYRGELLEGLNPRSLAFEDWLTVERSRLWEYATQALAALLQHYLESGAKEQAIQFSVRLLALDPLREPVHRTLMQLYAQLGRYGAALKQYHVCRTVLQRELQVAPEPATGQLHQALLQQRQRSTNTADGPRIINESKAMQAASGSCPSERSCELRQVTVLQARLADFSASARQHDPEALQQSLNRFFAAVDDAIKGYHGAIVKHADAVVTGVFGIPSAHSNDTERALYAALAIHRELTAPLTAQIGIASGRVMAGELGSVHHHEYTAIGEPVDVAVALAAQAAGGETLIGETVCHSLAGRIDGEPVDDRAWRVRGIAEQARRQNHPGFVDRYLEQRQFAVACEICAETGSGQTLLVRGEAGIGKTRLVEEWATRAQQKGFVSHQVQVLDFGVGAAPDGVRLLVRSLLGLAPGNAVEYTRTGVEQALAQGLIEPDQQVFFNDLLDSAQSTEQRALLDAMDNATRQQGRQATIARLIEALSERQPLLLMIEDMHWADPETLDALAHIANLVPHCAVLLVLTSRVEGEPLDPAWRGAMHGAPLTTIDLGPLHDEEMRELASHYAVTDEAFVSRCIHRAEGNPLFLDQLLRSSEPDENIPDSIQSLVWARLDRLATADKRALQAASILGQHFSPTVLQHLIDDPDYSCRELIKPLFLQSTGREYRFVHTLIHETIYGTLLTSQRRQWHRRAADWFSGRDRVLYAEHLDRAEDPKAALAYFEAAKTQAQDYRYERALQLVERGLRLAAERSVKHRLTCLQGDLLRDLGFIEAAIAAFHRAMEQAVDDGERCQVWISLAACLSIKDRYGEALALLDKAEAVARHRERVDEPARSIGADAYKARHCGYANELAKIHYQRGNILFPLGRIDRCLKEHEQALGFAHGAGSPRSEACALSGLGDAYYLRGRMLMAYDYFDRCIGLCRSHGFCRIEVINRVMRGLTWFYRNQPDAALDDNREAVELAMQVNDRRTEMVARNAQGSLLPYQADWHQAMRQAKRSLMLARQLGAKRFEADNLCHLSAALVGLQRRAEAEKRLQQAYALSRESGATFSGPWILSVLANATDDLDKRHWALAEGEKLLVQGSVSHNYLHFYQNAMDVALADNDWHATQRYAGLLENYTRLEPLPWSDFFIARGQALAAWGSGQHDKSTWQELQRLAEEAKRASLRAALPALEAALAEN